MKTVKLGTTAVVAAGLIILTGCGGAAEAEADKESPKSTAEARTNEPTELQNKVPGFSADFAPFYGDGLPIDMPDRWNGHGGWSVRANGSSVSYEILGENVAFMAPAEAEDGNPTAFLADSSGNVLYRSDASLDLAEDDMSVIVSENKSYLAVKQTGTRENTDDFKVDSSFTRITVMDEEGVQVFTKDIDEGQGISLNKGVINLYGGETDLVLDPSTGQQAPVPHLDGHDWLGTSFGVDLFMTTAKTEGVFVTNGEWKHEISRSERVYESGLQFPGYEDEGWAIMLFGKFIQVYSGPEGEACQIVDTESGLPVDILATHAGACVAPLDVSPDGNLVAFSDGYMLAEDDGFTTFSGVLALEEGESFIAGLDEYEDISFSTPANGDTAYGVSGDSVAEVNLHDGTGLKKIPDLSALPTRVTDGGLAITSSPLETHFFLSE